MPRRSRRRPEPPPRRTPGERSEPRREGDWFVRPLSGASSTKDYTCPGCHRPVTAGTPHVVVWPVVKPLLSDAALDERRHWHTACWGRGR